MKKIIFLLFWMPIINIGFSQSTTLEVIPASGDVFTGSDISLSWTIGEGIIETFSNNEMVLTQGFQQPTLKITRIDESDDLDFQLNVYPNPTRDFLTVNMQSINDLTYTIELFDMSGKSLFIKQIKGSEFNETVDLTNYSSNLYILRIIDNSGKQLGTYKVQKIR